MKGIFSEQLDWGTSEPAFESSSYEDIKIAFDGKDIDTDSKYPY